MHSSIRSFITLAVGLSVAASAIGQAVRPPPITSPVVNPDRTVTVRFRAPDARKVELSGQFLTTNAPMVKDESGVWSVTVGPVGPVAPDLYPYNFVVDGVGVADPANQYVFPNEGFKGSLVDIPDPEPSLRSVQNVPHGEVSYGFYQSEALGCARPLVIYTPPGYRAGAERYPVLYLVSGTTDTEETWFRAGRVNFILDNLIAQHRAVPMIVVMPYGNMLMGTPRPWTPEVAVMYKAFADELVGQIVPYVEANYRALPEREGRAIAGFSRGGGQSLFTAFSHLTNSRGSAPTAPTSRPKFSTNTSPRSPPIRRPPTASSSCSGSVSARTISSSRRRRPSSTCWPHARSRTRNSSQKADIPG